MKAESFLARVEDRVKALRRRQSPLPGPRDIARFIRQTFPEEQREELAADVDKRGLGALVEALEGLTLPEGLPRLLCEAVCGAWRAAGDRDGRGYKDAVEAVRVACAAACYGGEGYWWGDERVAGHDFSSTESEEVVAAAAELTKLDIAGYLLSRGKHFRPRHGPAPVPPKVRDAAEVREQEGIESARRAGRPAEAATTTPDLGEKIVVACEEADPVTDEVLVVRRRRPGDPPFMPEGSKIYGSVEEWDPYA